ncbi:MAG: 6-phosphogluconolactonase, partial [Leuconostoc falkenbergense]
MNIIKVKNADEGAQKAFEIYQNVIKSGAKVLGLATGSSPIALYDRLSASDLDFSNMTSVNLDEYLGLDGDNDQSYRYFMNQ